MKRYAAWHECRRPRDFRLVVGGRPCRRVRKRCGVCAHWDLDTLAGFCAMCELEFRDVRDLKVVGAEEERHDG